MLPPMRLLDRLAQVPAWGVLGGVVVVSAGLRSWAALTVPTPWILPDEVIYGELGRSLYSTGSFEILGYPARFYGLVYPALVGLPLSLRDLELGYDLLKPLQALVMSLAAVPVYLWGRTLMRPGFALAAAVLTLTVPGLAYSGLVMTEVAFYPVATLAAWAMAAALARPTPVNQALATAAILLASATRLQAVVLAPVFVTAALLVGLFERDARRALRLWPAIAGLAAAGAGWAAWRLSEGPASELFAAYRAAGEVGYSVSDAILYARWHLADVLLMTGVIPACAAALLAVQAFAGRERSAAARAYLAVATALTAWLTVEVGVFASRHVGRLAERDLLALSPVLFLGLVLWLDRGAPRPRLVTALVGAAALGLVLALPVNRLVSHAAIPDAFTLIPLWRIQVRFPGVDLQLLLDLLAAAAVLAFALVPRRLAWTLPVAVGLVSAAASLNVGRVVAAEATLVRRGTLGDSPRWVDRAAHGRVVYLYSGEVLWSSVWETLFWNRKLEAVYRLAGTQVPHLQREHQPIVRIRPSGLVVNADGDPVRAEDLVAFAALDLAGRQLDYAFGPALVLWATESPLRVESRRHDLRRPDGTLRWMRVEVFGCRGDSLRLRLISPVAQRVLFMRDGHTFRSRRFGAGERWEGDLPIAGRARSGARPCWLGVQPEVDLVVEQAQVVDPQ